MQCGRRGKILKGRRYGPLMDIVPGHGRRAIVGGWIFNTLGIYPAGGIVASVVVAMAGAVILIWLSRVLKPA
jgi:uncharacterized membrane protein YeaQ/YmgE (transglycosylase-associated protein family)